MRIDVVTIFPDYLDPLRQSLPGKAIQSGLVDLQVHDLRRWTYDVHRSVDDSPYGGGPGMVMKAPVWGEALQRAAVACVNNRPAGVGTIKSVSAEAISSSASPHTGAFITIPGPPP
ncbi:hypothetical protein A5652_22880 [Mycobacterium sp. 1165178.9]|nr:hypothetical protein A5652_22880 [Mycobacterium sp. 1165178.9]